MISLLLLLIFQTDDPLSFTTLLQVLEGDNVRERRAAEQDGKAFLCWFVIFVASDIKGKKTTEEIY